MRTQFKFQQGAQSIQDAQCNDADTVDLLKIRYMVLKKYILTPNFEKNDNLTTVSVSLHYAS